MPVLDKKRKTWTGRVRLTGTKPKEKRGFPTKTAAREWERQTKINLKSPGSLDLLFSQAADKWLVACLKRNKPHTCNYKAIIINDILAFWEHDPYLKDIKPIQVEEYLNTLPGKTANRHKRELTTFFLFCIKRELIYDNPASAIERFKEEPFLRYVPPQKDIQAVLDVAPKSEKNIILFAYHTLARAGEVRHVLWEDVDFKRRVITLWTSKTRTGNREQDTLDMTDTLYNILIEMNKTKINDHVFNHNGLPLKKWWLNEVLEKLCKQAKIKYYSFHCIRHHVAALLCYKLSLIEISKILRHKNVTTTDIYLRSIVKIETKGIKVLDDLSKTYSENIVPFSKAAVSK